MINYIFWGKSIVFDDGAERFFDLQYQSWTAQECARKDFTNWYQTRKNIEVILSQYRKFCGELIEKYAINLLFPTLAHDGIFDVSKETYYRECFDLTGADNAWQSIQSQYAQINQAQEDAEEYRRIRKASRSRWSGGGFGLGSALKGAAQAGALNAVSGLGHSMVNAVGNAGSAVTAASEKQNLYNKNRTSEILFEGISTCLFAAYQSHMDLVNDRKGENYIQSKFSFDRSSALFENAKKMAIGGKSF